MFSESLPGYDAWKLREPPEYAGDPSCSGCFHEEWEHDGDEGCTECMCTGYYVYDAQDLAELRAEMRGDRI